MSHNPDHTKQLIHVTSPGKETAFSTTFDEAIGKFLRQNKGLTEAQIEQILLYQRAQHVRFGEAAVALNLASPDDVLWALSQQFHYPYSSKERMPAYAEVVVASDPFGEQAEVFRDLRSQLLADAMRKDAVRAAIAIVSADTGDGKTFFAANLAAVLSQLGGRTLLVDADLRTPRQHHIFKSGAQAGLSSILMGRDPAPLIHAIPDLPSMFMLPAGTVPPNPLELVQRPAFGALIRHLLTQFDHVIVDTPAAVHGADAKVIAAQCGTAIALGRKGMSTVRSLQKLVTSLEKSATRISGVIINER